MVAAIKAASARSGIGSHNSIADPPISSVCPGFWILYLTDYASQFMAEHGRRDNHFGVIASFEHFKVGATGQGGFDLNPHFACVQGWRGDVFDTDVFFAIKDSSFHAGCLWGQTRQSSTVNRQIRLQPWGITNQNDLAARLRAAGLPVRTEVPITVTCRDFAKTYFLDLVVADTAIYELKTALGLIGEHEAQLLNYLLLRG